MPPQPAYDSHILAWSTVAVEAKEVMEGQGAVDCSQAAKQEAERGKGGPMAYLGSDPIVLVEAMSPLRPKPSGI